MFTVKIIDRNEDMERILEAENVIRCGRTVSIFTSGDDGEVLGVDENGDEKLVPDELTITIYVMNRNGATVATYHI